MFCGNVDKLKSFKELCIRFNIMDELMIPKYHDRAAAQHADIWYGPMTRKLALEHW